MPRLYKDIVERGYWEKILFLIFPASIVVDLLNGFMQLRLGIHLPIGQLYRIIIICILIKHIYVNRNTLSLLLYLLGIISVFCIALTSWTFESTFSIQIEINNFIRIIYFILMILFFISNQNKIKNIDIYAFVLNYGFIIGSCILFSFITGFGHHSYGEDYGFGTKSYFKAGNDLSLTLLYSAALSSIYIYNNTKISNLIKYIIIILGCILVGTRTGIIGAVFIATISYLYYIYFHRTHNQKERIHKSIILLISIPLLTYVVYIIVMTIYDIFDQYTLDRFTLESIFSAREALIDGAKSHIKTFDGLDILLGKGVLPLFESVAIYNNMGNDQRAVEADYYEIIGSYGYMFGWIVIFPFIWFALWSTYKYIKRPNLQTFWLAFIFWSFLYLSYSAGHGIKNTMLPPIYAFAVILLHTNNILSINEDIGNK